MMLMNDRPAHQSDFDAGPHLPRAERAVFLRPDEFDEAWLANRENGRFRNTAARFR